MAENVLKITERKQFREWLAEHHDTEKECWIALKRGKPSGDEDFRYLDAVEEALCFGWIDSTLGMVDGIRMQRFTPRRKNSLWTELNKERVRRLERLGLMTEAGRKVLPAMGPRSFTADPEVINELKKARVYAKFMRFPALYRRIRICNLMFYKKQKMTVEYERGLKHLIDTARNGEMFGEWNDYGRLTEE